MKKTEDCSHWTQSNPIHGWTQSMSNSVAHQFSSQFDIELIGRRKTRKLCVYYTIRRSSKCNFRGLTLRYHILFLWWWFVQKIIETGSRQTPSFGRSGCLSRWYRHRRQPWGNGGCIPQNLRRGMAILPSLQYEWLTWHNRHNKSLMYVYYRVSTRLQHAFF